MKAVDPALAHAGDVSPFPLGTSDADDEDFETVTRPTTKNGCNGVPDGGKQQRALDPHGKSAGDEDFDTVTRPTAKNGCNGVPGDGGKQQRALDPHGKSAGEHLCNVKNLQDLKVDGKSEITRPKERVNGQEVIHNGTTQYSNGLVVNGRSKITNGGLESGGIVENGHDNYKVNGCLESGEKVVENGHDRKVQVNGNSKINGGLESDGKVVENGHDTRIKVNGTCKINGGLESDGQVVENGQEKRVKVNGNSQINGGLEGKVVENGHDTRMQINGNSQINGGFESGEKVGENGHTRRVHVNGSPSIKGGLECGDVLTENGGGSESPNATWDRTVAEMKEHAFARLQDELKKAHQELKLRDEEVTRLSRIRQDVEAELEDLTASLFQEAHNMVREANVKQAAAERAHKESQMQVDVLVAEVSALKTLVLTSTPSRPNPHLHPQIDLRGNRTKDDSSLGATGIFNKKHRRSPSHFNLKYGRENSPPDSPVKEAQPLPVDPLNCKEGWEVDPDVHREFTAWKLNPKLDKSDPFISRIYNEEINLCLDFPNKELSAHVRKAVESGNIFIEAVSDKTKTVFPKKCALLDVPRQCHYRMKFGDQEQWYCMSQICRNRIIAVCDFLNYLQYIERGLVKSSAHDVYWEITRLRKDMVLARLGLALLS